MTKEQKDRLQEALRREKRGRKGLSQARTVEPVGNAVSYWEGFVKEASRITDRIIAEIEASR